MIKSTGAKALFQLIPEDKFKKLVKKWEIDKKVKTLTTYSQFKIMTLSYLLGIHTFREIELAFGVAKSTFGDACQKRSSGFFEDLAKTILWEIHKNTKGRKHKKVVREILAIDSTHSKVPSILAKLFRWKNKANKNSGDSKLHVVWNVDKEWIEDFRVTGGLDNDLTVGKKLELRSGCTYVFDRAYVDLSFWIKIEKRNSHFVTRLKRRRKETKILNDIEKEYPEKIGVLLDKEWYPSETTCLRCGIPAKILTYRQIVYRAPETKKLFHFITSDFNIDAQEVAGIYKQRWSVELLFKWMKGHLGIRSFAVKSKNAIKSWLAVSVCVHLLMSLKKIIENFSGNLLELFRKVKIETMLQSSINRVFEDFCPRKPALGGCLKDDGS